MKPRKAWIIYWLCNVEPIVNEKYFFHIIKPNFKKEKIKFYLKNLYINSFMFTAIERLQLISNDNHPALSITDSGNKLTIGSNPCLEAVKVKNLIIDHNQSGEQIIKYEIPPSEIFDREKERQVKKGQRIFESITLKQNHAEF